MVTDPTDVCCQKPECNFQSILKNVSGTVPPNLIPTLAPPAIITGQINTPAPTPGPGPTPKPISKFNECFFLVSTSSYVEGISNRGIGKGTSRNVNVTLWY